MTDKKNTLIAWYSWSGNTSHIAGIINQKTGGRLFEIQPVVKYPENYNSCVKQAKKEINAGFVPELKNLPGNIDDTDTVFIGSPIWWHTMAPPVLGLLQSIDLSGKTVVPFCTHGGGGNGHFIEDVTGNCPLSKVLEGLTLYGNGGSRAGTEIDDWLRKTGI